MSKILINGDFLCRQMTGIERFAFEISLRLDRLSKPNEIAIIFPKNTCNIPSFSNFEVIHYDRNYRSHILWQMLTLQWFLITHKKYIILEFGNTCFPLAPGIVFLHDIYCEIYPKDFVTFRDKLARLYNRYQYRLICKKAKEIITVSEFSKTQISKHFNVPSNRISVINNGWDHFKHISSDYSIFRNFPQLKPKNYFFALGSLSKRKNLIWIIQYAKKHPDTLFAISGTSLPVFKVKELEEMTLFENIILLGYIDDGKAKALMEKCIAFIMPSYYEGFGIPPLEALSCGSPVVISRCASLPEIYGNAAHYIDPHDTNIDLKKIISEPVESPETILERYTYDNAAELLFKIIDKYTSRL
jgi:glycosyltransferase involved in cell wall biosynthesis